MIGRNEAAFQKSAALSAVKENCTVAKYDLLLVSDMQTYYRVKIFTLENGLFKQKFKTYV